VANKETKKKICFAVTPIGDEGSEIRLRSDQVLMHIIEPVMGDLGYETVRADRSSQPGMITNQVIEHLIDDELVVADLTGSNPNVFYELAIRHATRKPIVTIIEAGERIPFDVNQSRTIHVNHHDLDSVADCKKNIDAQVRALEKNPRNFFTPVSVAIDLRAMNESGSPEAQRDAQVLFALQAIQMQIGELGGEVSKLNNRPSVPLSSASRIDNLVAETEARSYRKYPGEAGYIAGITGPPWERAELEIRQVRLANLKARLEGEQKALDTDLIITMNEKANE
jgi:hypothetical protein